MSRFLIEEYARLLTPDTGGCTALFAEDAEFITA